MAEAWDPGVGRRRPEPPAPLYTPVEPFPKPGWPWLPQWYGRSPPGDEYDDEGVPGGFRPWFWEKRAGRWGPPGIFLPEPMRQMAETYPIRPSFLERMMRIRVDPTGPKILGVLPYPTAGGRVAGYDPYVNRLYMPPWATAPTALHEYGHAMEQFAPPGFERAFEEVEATQTYPRVLGWYEGWQRTLPLLNRMMWGARKRLGGRAREAYAEYPVNWFVRGVPMPEEVREFYPWLDIGTTTPAYESRRERLERLREAFQRIITDLGRE